MRPTRTLPPSSYSKHMRKLMTNRPSYGRLPCCAGLRLRLVRAAGQQHPPVHIGGYVMGTSVAIQASLLTKQGKLEAEAEAEAQRRCYGGF